MAIYTIAMWSYPRVILMILKSMSMVELCWTKAASFVLGLSASNGRMRRARCAIGGAGSRWKIGIWDTQGWDIWCEYTVVFNFIYGYTFTYMVGGLSYVVLNPETPKGDYDFVFEICGIAWNQSIGSRSGSHGL